MILLLLLGHSIARADELVDTVEVARPATSWHRLYFRAGAANVAPHVRSREMELSNIMGPASLSLHDGPIAGSGANVAAQTVPAVIVGYTLPWLHDHLAVETILGTPLDVKFTATGTLASQSLAPTALGIPTGVMPLGSELGETKGVPIVATVVYSPLDRGGAVAPFVGAGPSVLFAYGSKITNPILTEVSQPQMHVSPAVGFVMQAGADVRLYKRVRVRLDVKYVAGMLASAEVEHIKVRTPDLPLFDAVDVGTAKMSLWLNPLIVQLGVGMDL